MLTSDQPLNIYFLTFFYFLLFTHALIVPDYYGKHIKPAEKFEKLGNVLNPLKNTNLLISKSKDLKCDQRLNLVFKIYMNILKLIYINLSVTFYLKILSLQY